MFNHRTRRNVLFTIQETLGWALSQTRNISGESHFRSPQFPLAVPFHPHSKHSSALALNANHNLNHNRNLRQGPRFETAQRITLFAVFSYPWSPFPMELFDFLYLWFWMQNQAVAYTGHLSSPCTGLVQAHRKKAQDKSQFSMKENKGQGLFRGVKGKETVMGSTCMYQNSYKAPVNTFTKGVDMDMSAMTAD